MFIALKKHRHPRIQLKFLYVTWVANAERHDNLATLDKQTNNSSPWEYLRKRFSQPVDP
jgi:hypothetical protein